MADQPAIKRGNSSTRTEDSLRGARLRPAPVSTTAAASVRSSTSSSADASTTIAATPAPPTPRPLAIPTGTPAPARAPAPAAVRSGRSAANASGTLRERRSRTLDPDLGTTAVPGDPPPHGQGAVTSALGTTLMMLLVLGPGMRWAQVSPPRPVIELNGQPLARGVMLRSALSWRSDELFVPLCDLRLAVDGPGAGRGSRLRQEGRQLVATRTGGCEGCRVRVARAVLVSSGVRYVANEPHVPLADIVRAFEGRLDVDPHAGVYRIHAGVCRWCVLEVVGRTARGRR
jgi:hypothetical protein